MLKLLQTFVDIALWRKGPQDVPASLLVTIGVLILYLTTSVIQVQLFNVRLRTATTIIAVDVVMLMTWLWLVLAFFGRRQRFGQTVTAALGVGVLLGTLDIIVRGIQLAMGSAQDMPDFWLLLRFFAIALIMGRIFMHALDRGLLTGMALTVAIVYSTEAVSQMLLDVGR